LAHDQLNKRPLILVIFPRSGFFARAHADNDLAKANSFTGFDFKVAGLAVALVKQADHRNPFGHWRADLRAIAGNGLVRTRGCFGLGFRLRFRFAAVATGQKDCCR
jgi:hypothetical protein